MGSTLVDSASASAASDVPELHWGAPLGPVEDGDAMAETWALPASLIADLHHASLVVSDGYIGPDRRASGVKARFLRATFTQRRFLLRLELAAIVVVALVVMASVLLVGGGARASASPSLGTSSIAATSKAATPVTVPALSAVPGARPTPVATVPTTATPTTAAPVAAPVDTGSLTPAQMGAAALALVRYPWQSIPGYSIEFLPIADAPSAGFYGNTTFTWGKAGGQSIMYVYPGETVDRLAAITAFEIGHEVDAAGVEPLNGGTGHAAIENIVGVHPTSWAPDCDCAEQGFLSGWYAAAFSDYWSPGVGDWSQLAAEPTGATRAALEPYLNPVITG
jgi:hypothetical protein